MTTDSRPTGTADGDDLAAEPVGPAPPVAVTLAIAAGVAWALAAPPRGWWPLLPLGVASLTIALYGRG
ncbi:hypothetical protein, partial [Pseudonocardia nigra]|uniref:hypothetical protein n=1 Tax=Pseudonocardia nigra TaxID=1921578 RepID=UPI001C5F07FD